MISRPACQYSVFRSQAVTTLTSIANEDAGFLKSLFLPLRREGDVRTPGLASNALDRCTQR